ncbi:MAG: T9SS type A sorting domain-containing protein [Saprospiraceae bacterium]|nr:T9SS type A sorting domain-containing protein [Saprospiraceae bacterium]
MARRLLFVFFIFLSFKIFGQLTNGSIAPDFSVEDINGNTYSLYAMMGSNKSACLDFSATWCSPCWAFHTSGVLESVYNNLGNETTVVMLESDWNTNTNCLYGPSGCNSSTQGNWVAGIPYQIADLSGSNGASVNNDYNINYYPTLYVISPDKRSWEIGTRTYQNYANWITKSFKLAATANLTNSTCGDNGKIVLNVTGGFSTLSYKWSNGMTSKDLNNLPGGTYSVTITDVNTYFKEFGPFTIDGPTKRVDIVSSQLIHVKCFNEPTGSIFINVNYGTPPYNFNWSNGNTTDAPDNLKAGTYTVTVTDNAGCTKVKSYTLNQPSDLTLSTVPGKETCDEINGFIQAKANGGIFPYDYDLGFGQQTSPYFSDLKGEKSYTVTVTDANGCEETSTTYVDATHKPDVHAGTDKPLDCKKEIINLDGSQSSQGGAFIYLWTTKEGNIVKGQETLLPDVNLPGKYFLKVTDAGNKCFDVDSVVVLDKRVFPNIQSSNDTTLNCVFLETELKGTSKDLQTKFYWKKQNDTSFLIQGKSILVNVDAKYILHVKDTINLCVSKDTIEIKKDQLVPEAIANPEKDVSCINTEVIIDGSASSKGANFKYLWTSANGNIVTGANTLMPIVNKGGDYEFQVENTQNFCKAFATVIVFEQTIPEAAFEQSVTGLNIQLTDQSKGIPTKWNWSFGDGAISSLKNPTHSYTSDGEYEICLTINNDCGEHIKCNKILVGISAALNLASWDIHNVSCFGGSNGKIKINVQGGVPPYQYIWNTQQQSNEISDLSIGNYSVQIIDQQGTKIVKSFTITQPLEISLKNQQITGSNAGADNGSISLDVEGGIPQYTYLWSNGQLTNPAINLAPGDYTCSLTDANSCIKVLGPFIVKELTLNNEIDFVKQFELRPNPVSSKGSIYVDLDRSKLFNLSLVNIFGKELWSKQYSAKSIIELVDVSDFSKGIYFIVLRTEHKKEVLKWIVE